MVMLSVLGWDGVVHGHLIAFFTFEAIAGIEIAPIVLMLFWTAPPNSRLNAQGLELVNVEQPPRCPTSTG